MKTAFLFIQQEDNIELYELDSKFAESNTGSTEPVKYIKDGADPFTDNVIKIEEVSDEKHGYVPVNDPSKEDSIYTPSYNVVQIPYANSNNIIHIFYRADHDKIPLDTTDPATVELKLGNIYKEALALYVAFRSHYAMGSEGSMAQGKEYSIMFETMCARLKNRGMEQVGGEDYIRLDAMGWV